MVQWLRIHLAMKGCRFNSWLGNWDPTGQKAAKSKPTATEPVPHNQSPHASVKEPTWHREVLRQPDKQRND